MLLCTNNHLSLLQTLDSIMRIFHVNDISEYRTELMGVATLLVIFGHSAGNGVVMPGWMESLCGLASVGVDIFLLVSGLGLWYSLQKFVLTNWGGYLLGIEEDTQEFLCHIC